jgi:molecular chaperone GrpE
MNNKTPNEQDPYAPSDLDDQFDNDFAASAEFEGEEAQESEADRVANLIASLQAEVAAAKDQTLRALADAENTRRRAIKDREDAGKYAISAFARDLLDFSDNFQRALNAIPDESRADESVAPIMQGIEAMEKDFLNTIEKHGIQKISPMGEMFNPNFHEAMFEAVGTGQPAGMIIQVIEPGYILKERLLRPARVGIAKDDGNPKGPAGSTIDTQA